MARKTRTESYGSDVRRSASYVDRILKGEKRGDLPVQAPTKYKSTPKVASRLLTSLDMLSFCWFHAAGGATGHRPASRHPSGREPRTRGHSSKLTAGSDGADGLASS